jgi:hypothetical protein
MRFNGFIIVGIKINIFFDIKLLFFNVNDLLLVILFLL